MSKLANNNDSFLSTIDRITSKAFEASVSSKLDFIPAATWQGPKVGYYFGTAHQGTGYYVDQHISNLKRQRNENGFAVEDSEIQPKRRVRFGENQVKTIPSSIERQTPAELLKEAEEEQKNKRIKTLDLSRGPSSLRTFVQNLEKSIAKNELLRADYADQPEKFMESELALYEDIAVLNDLATNVAYYGTFVELGAVDQLLALLGHDNVDVALAVVRLFLELLDPTLLEDDEQGDLRNGMSALMEAFVGTGDKINGGIGMVVANLSRLHEQEEEEVKGIEDIFTLIENMIDLDQLGAWQQQQQQQSQQEMSDAFLSIVAIICKFTPFVPYLLLHLGNLELSNWSISLRLHAAELLATILQDEDSRKYIHNLSDLKYDASIFDQNTVSTKKTQTKVDGIEYLLQCVAKYRKKDPTSEEECEYLENIFDALAASLLHEKNVEAFLERQGVELMLRCVGERVHSGYGAFKVLAFALTGPASDSAIGYKRASEIFVEAGGFKSFFPIFMGRKHAMPQPSENCDAGNIALLSKYAKLSKNEEEKQQQKPSRKMKEVVSASKEWHRTLEANAIQILYGLTRHLDDNSPNEANLRLLAKFIENDCEKCDRMIELCLKYDSKMRRAEYLYFRSDEAEEAEATGIDVELAALNAKLKGGGDLFHRISAAIAFAISGSKRCHEHVITQLRTHNSGIGLIKAGCEEFISILDEGEHRNILKRYLQSM